MRAPLPDAGSRPRIESLADPGSFVEEAADLHSEDPLDFFDLRPYTERLAEAEMKTGLADAMVIGQAAIDGRGCELAVMDFAFMGGSMGSVVGEKFSRACDSAAERGVPLIAVTSSGGARMQEGILALMQLPKTVAAVEDLRDAGQAMISVMAHPTTGGVLASFATLGDVLLAEPGALMSFAGPRVVQQLTREKLPDDFGLAEQNLRFGNLDAIVPRPELRPTLVQTAEAVRCPRLSTSCACASDSAGSGTCPCSAAPSSPASSTGSSGSSTGWARRRPTRRSGSPSSWRATSERPYTLDYVERLLDDWFELHGDRGRADDGAMIAGLGKLDGRTVALVGQQKGRDIQERADRRFGMPNPEGYREGDARHGARRPARLPGRSRSSTRRARTRASPPSSTARAARSPPRRR